MTDTSILIIGIDENGDEMTFRLYSISEEEFGRKSGMLKLKFGSRCVKYDDLTCKKLNHHPI